MTDSSAQQAVDSILACAGLTVTDEEYARLLRIYPEWQSQLAELRVPEARYREPAIVYSPE